MRIPRSYLYVPANAPDKIEKAWRGHADALILDLEDAVPWAEKETARSGLRQWLLGAEPATEEAAAAKEVWVRINPGDAAADDIAVLQGVSVLTGLVLAKAESAESVRDTGELLARSGLGALALSPLLETAGAILHASSIARQPRVRMLQIGEYDLCAELGVTPGDDESELTAARSAVVLASSAAHTVPPVAPVSVEIRDSAAFRRTTERCARLGFVGRACIHPAQLGPVHDAFTPSSAEVERSEQVVASFEEHQANGSGVLLDSEGRMVDEAVVRSARRVLALARDTISIDTSDI